MKKLLSILLTVAFLGVGTAHAQWAQFANSTAFFSTPTTVGGIAPGTAGQAYSSNGPLLPPSFGTLSCLGGGTGLSAAPAAGSLLIGTGTCWQIGTIQGGTNVTITNTGGVITISSTGGGGGSITLETNGVANANQNIFNLLDSAATDGLILTAINTSNGNVQLGFTGALTNAGLANSSITLGSTNVALGATATTLAGFSSISSTSFTGALTGNASTATTASGLSGLPADTIICNPTGSIANSQTCTLGTNLSFAGNVINATAGAGGVASITGDGALITNSSSTGGVTLTLGNAVGYGIWGNIGSGSAGPGYHALSAYPTAAFPTLNQNTTGTAANITASSNATLTTLSALSLPYSQLTGAPTSLPASSVTVGTTVVTGGTTTDVLYDNGGTLGNTNAPAISGANLTALPTTAALYPTLNQDTTGNAATATAATNLSAGTANQIPYQTAASTTSFFSAANYGVQIYGATSVPSALAGAAGVLQGSASAIPAWTTTPTLTGTNFTAIPNGALTNSSVTIGSTNVSLGATAATVAGLTLTGASVAGSVAATTLSASSTVSGTGFSTYLASPPAIGGTAAAAGSFTTVHATGQLTSTVSTGTAPLVIASTTQVPNLNAATAGAATNISGGSANQLPYQTAAGATSFETTLAAVQMPALAGDLTGTAGSLSVKVTGVNNATIPLSAPCAGTNASGQFISATTCVTETGSPSAGNIAAFASSNTVTPATSAQIATALSATPQAITVSNCTGCGSGSVTDGSGTTTAGELLESTATAHAYGLITLGGGLAISSGVLGASYSVRVVSSTSDTILSTDCANGVEYTSSSAVAVTLPQATGTFASCNVDIIVNGTGTVTVTPTTSTINGGSSAAIAGSRNANITALSGNYVATGTYQVTGTQTIASGTATLGTSAIASGACATVVTVAATGVATTDVVQTGFNSDPTAVTGYGASSTGAVLTIYPYPTAGDINVKVCNSSSGSITPGAMTLNWRVVR